MRVLGIDLGTRHTGFAISDSLKLIASSLENFDHDEKDFNQLIIKIKQIQEKYNNEIDTIVIGYPMNLNGSKSEMTKLVEAFIDKLNKEFQNLKVIKINEQFSTVHTISILKSQHKIKGSKIRKIKDKLAATYLLQNYLDYGCKKS